METFHKKLKIFLCKNFIENCLKNPNYRSLRQKEVLLFELLNGFSAQESYLRKRVLDTFLWTTVTIPLKNAFQWKYIEV